MAQDALTPQQRWNRAHPETGRKATAKWRAKPENRERSRATARDWKKANPARHCAINAKRKAVKLAQTPEDADLVLIQQFYDEAARLTRETGIEHQVDHVKPLSKGGLHHQGNLQVLTAEANLAKGDKYDDREVQSQGA